MEKLTGSKPNMTARGHNGNCLRVLELKASFQSHIAV